MFYSPLRYPGGKKNLAAFIAKICIENKCEQHYVEPYSGGASVALCLLLEGFVKKITINDKDRSIYAFWHSILYDTDRFCSEIEKVNLCIGEWKKQKEIQFKKKHADLFELGFSTFYLNRTNRSGIINAGVMGGLKQDGNYLMDCRFNKSDLIRRIERIAQHKKNIQLYKKDAIRLIDKIQSESQNTETFFYFDPPYYLKSNTLYMNHYNYNDHRNLSDKIKSIKKNKWIVSYDNTTEINKLYSEYLKKEFSFKHTVYETRVGKEVMFFSKNIKQPELRDWNPIKFKVKKINNYNEIVYKG